MKISSLVLSLFIIGNIYGQQFNSDFKTTTVNKKVKEFPDKFDLTSPLNSFITLKYILMNGKDGLQWKICAANKIPFVPDSATADRKVTSEERQLHLNTIIEEIILYKDSVAFVISKLYQNNGEAFYSARNFHPEHGKWVVNGEDLFSNIERVNEYVRSRAEFFYKDYELGRNN